MRNRSKHVHFLGRVGISYSPPCKIPKSSCTCNSHKCPSRAISSCSWRCKHSYSQMGSKSNGDTQPQEPTKNQSLNTILHKATQHEPQANQLGRATPLIKEKRIPNSKDTKLIMLMIRWKKYSPTKEQHDKLYVVLGWIFAISPYFVESKTSIMLNTRTQKEKAQLHTSMTQLLSKHNHR